MRSLLILVVLLPSVAAADSLGPPPRDCPSGAVGRSNRSGAFCTPTSCGDPETEGCPAQPFCPERSWPCPSPEPWTCSAEPMALCVRTEDWVDRRGIGGPVTHTREVALGPCGEGDGCPDRAVCQRARRCLHAPPAPPPPPPAEPPPVPDPSPPGPSAAGALPGSATGSSSGCACRAGPTGAAPWPALLLVALAWRWRRR
ncbi:MAG: hypothetical protein KC619_04530 [Myxococcales bacterium]|nr:hypothetical protein [Myxococcales bacterium]